MTQVAEELQTSKAQVYALVRRGDLRAIKIGGRGVWRVGRQDLEDFIEDAREKTRQWLVDNPYSPEELAPEDSEVDPGEEPESGLSTAE